VGTTHLFQPDDNLTTANPKLRDKFKAEEKNSNLMPRHWCSGPQDQDVHIWVHGDRVALNQVGISPANRVASEIRAKALQLLLQKRNHHGTALSPSGSQPVRLSVRQFSQRSRTSPRVEH